MIRVVIENIILFFLPAALYVSWVLLTRTDTGKPVLDTAPVVWLLISGTMLVIIFLISFGSTTGGLPGQIYEPPSFKDGQIIPGRFK